MVVPIVVFCPTDTYPKGWGAAPVDIPIWWDESFPEEVQKEPAPPDREPITAQGLGPLFAFAQEEREKARSESIVVTSGEPTHEWLMTLLASPTFGAQKKLAGRAVPADEVLAKLLVAFDRRGGKLTATALARAIDYPPLRLPGLLAVVQRILNIDGYAVLTRDEASDTIEFNRELLCRQFDVVSSS
jgi:hypothetical protein